MTLANVAKPTVSLSQNPHNYSPRSKKPTQMQKNSHPGRKNRAEKRPPGRIIKIAPFLPQGAEQTQTNIKRD